MKSKLIKIMATVMSIAMIFTCMAFAAPALAADDSSLGSTIDTDKLLEFAKENPLLAKIGLKVALWAAGNAIEGAAEAVGDHYEDLGEDAGDRFEDFGDNIEDGNLADIENPQDIVDDIVDGATDADDIGHDAADGATESFPINILAIVKPELSNSINAKLADLFIPAFSKVFDNFRK